MKKVLLLLVILIALIGVTVMVQKQQDASFSTASRVGKKARERLFPDFDWSAIQKLRIKDSSSEVNVGVAGDHWGVKERADYPASFERIQRVLMELREQKIASKQEVGKNAWTKIKVQSPAENVTEGVGTLVELMDVKGNVLKSFILGSNVESSGGQNANPMMGSSQRFVRIPEDNETIWVVSNTFVDLEPKPDSWLDKGFVDVQKIKDVTVTAPNATDSWKVSKATEEDEFALADAKNGEALDPAKVSLATLLSAPSFNDVVPKEKGAEKLKSATKARLTTFDGFIYDVQTAKFSEGGADKYFLSVDVTADIPATRVPGKDEKEEDKKKKDEEFAAKKKTLEEKLAKEKKHSGWVYEVSEYTVNNLLKKRSEILAAPLPKIEPGPAEKAAPGAMTPPSFNLPGFPAKAPGVSIAPPSGNKPISVTTPPIAVPPLPKQEIKPTPSSDTNPATGEKPDASPAVPATPKP